jgi:hypothetical protein
MWNQKAGWKSGSGNGEQGEMSLGPMGQNACKTLFSFAYAQAVKALSSAKAKFREELVQEKENFSMSRAWPEPSSELNRGGGLRVG